MSVSEGGGLITFSGHTMPTGNLQDIKSSIPVFAGVPLPSCSCSLCVCMVKVMVFFSPWIL